MANRVGQHYGEYRLTRFLGKGGFGDVYQGEHVRDGTHVAVKVLRTEVSSVKDLRSFLNEARTFRLKHPHIVQLLDFGVGEDDIPFLIIEYAPHGTLRHRHPRGTLVPLTSIVIYIEQVASALHYAHTLKLIHRDIKPENMLLGPNQEILLSDFGLAAVAHSFESVVSLAADGTPYYMAPEQIQRIPVAASDQYALAVVVYEWLTGTRPFEGSLAEIVAQHLSMPPPPFPKDLNIPPLVEEVVRRALAKDPKDRFATVQAFATALKQASLPTPLPKPTPSIPLPEPLEPPAAQNANMMNEQQAVQQTNAAALDAAAGAAGIAAGLERVSLSESDKDMPVAPLLSAPDGEEDKLSPPLVDPSLPPIVAPLPTIQLNDTTKDPSVIETGAVGAISTVSPAGTPHAGNTILARLGGLLPIRSNVGRGRGGRGAETGERRKIRPLGWLLIVVSVLLTLLILFVVIAYAAPGVLGPLANIVPGAGGPPTASITITPTTKQVKNTYVVTAMTDVADPLQRQVQARQLSFTSPTQSKTVKTTGKGQISAIEAKGALTFYNTSPQEQTIPIGTVLTDANGVQIITNEQIVLPAAIPPTEGIGTSLAHAAKPGVSGNIVSLDFNSSPCCATGVFVTNVDAFTGGADIQNYGYLQQSDIDGAASALQISLTQSAQTGLQKELHSGEQFIADARCIPNIVADSAAGHKADMVMVTVSVTCTGEVYDQQAALTLAANLLKKDPTVDPGKDYALTGNVVTQMTQVMLLDPKKGTISVTVEAAGLWAYQFSNAQLLVFKQLMVGKSQSDANAALLTQPGVDKANIQLSGGDGTTLPTDLKQITLLVLQVPGLKAIPR